MSEVTMRQMLEAGVHFGHQTCYWSPKMSPYIYGERNKIHIINLEHSLPMFRQSLEYLGKVAATGGVILFVGTKRQASAIVREHAQRCGMHWVDRRWLGGMLTNHKTIRKSIDRLKQMDAHVEDGSVEHLTKNERMRFERERTKLNSSLSGIRDMDNLPDCMFIIDVRHEYIAVQEANKLGIPVVAVVDTNCTPQGVDYVIPGNDDASRAIRLYLEHVSEAIIKARVRAGHDGDAGLARRGDEAAAAMMPGDAQAEAETSEAESGESEEAHTAAGSAEMPAGAPSDRPGNVTRDAVASEPPPAAASTISQTSERDVGDVLATAGPSAAPSDGDDVPAVAMPAITAAHVKALREQTGAGMMDCKNALAESGGDMEAAVAVLRKKNIASAERKAGRLASEGAVVTRIGDNGQHGLLLEVNCETDFVASGEAFGDFLKQLGDVLLTHGASAGAELNLEALGALPIVDSGTNGEASVESARLALSAQVGENICIRRFTMLTAEGAQLVAYNHGRRIGVLLSVQGDADVARDVAMHVAAMNPLCVSAEQVPTDMVAAEREIYIAQAADSGKPANIVDKMIDGRMRKFLNENALLGQTFVKDTSCTVGDYLQRNNTVVNRFVRYELGAGLEKRRDDFVADVQAQAGVS